MFGNKQFTFVGIHLEVIILEPFDQTFCVFVKEMQKIVDCVIDSIRCSIVSVVGYVTVLNKEKYVIKIYVK